MKKKIAALILLSMFSVIALAACSSDTTPVWQTDKSAPWYNNNRYERIEYDYSRWTVDDDGYTKSEAAAGKYICETVGIKNIGELNGIIPTGSLSLTENSNYSYTLLKTSLTVNYNDGKEDKLNTNLLYYTMDMLPIYLVKSADYSSTGTKYEIETNYINLTNTGFIFEDGERKDFTTAVDKNVNASVFDSDLIYYAARARSSLAADTTFSFSVYSPIDSAIENKKKTYSMYFETGAMDVAVDKDNKFIKNCFTQESMPKEWTNEDGAVTGDGYCLPSTYARMRINATKQGIYTHLFYAADDFNVMGMNMSKVLLRIQKDEYDTNTSSITYRNIYKISDYSISK